MKNIKIYKLIPYLLAGSLSLTACGTEPSCGLTNNSHVHLYTKEVNDDITIKKWKDSEQVSDFDGYIWNEELIEINKPDEEFYKELNKYNLFDGIKNFNYLYYEMANDQDYLEYYYEYETIETYTTTDSNGNTTVHTNTVTHNGWTRNKNYCENTGKVRLAHHKYSAYRVLNINGRLIVEESPLVDDIREVLQDYPYVKEDNSEIEYKKYKYSKYQVKHLEVEDFYEENNHPDLSNTSSELTNTKTR